MASAATSLPAPAHQAAKSALNAALAENNIVDKDGAQNGDDGEPGEIQEVDMQAQAENIRTVFNDPKNFNVKVCALIRLRPCRTRTCDVLICAFLPL